MARPDVFDSLNALTGMQGDQAQSDYESAPLPYETPAMTTGRVQQAQTQRVNYGRMKAQDLASRGIPYDTSGRGNVSEITDDTGAPLSNADKANKIAYDSSGKPVDYSQKDPTTGKRVLRDPYEFAPTQTDAAGNIYKAPKALPWQQTGEVDPVVRQQAQTKVNTQTATALAPVEQQAKATLTQAAKAVKISGAQTKQALQTQGVIIDPNAPDAPKQLDDSFNREYAAPEANATPFWGGGTRTPEAEALRKQIDARKASANAALASHQQVVTSAQQAQAQLDEVRTTRQSLQGDKMVELNRRRVAVGLDPINLGGPQTGPSASVVQQQGAALDAGPAIGVTSPLPTPSPIAAAQPTAPVLPEAATPAPAFTPTPDLHAQAEAATQQALAAMPKSDALPAQQPQSDSQLPTGDGSGRQQPLKLIDSPEGSGATEADYPLESLGGLTRTKVAAARANDYRQPSFAESATTPTIEVLKRMGPEEAGTVARSLDKFGILEGLDAQTVNRVASVLQNVSSDTVNFFTSPLGVATLGIGALPKAAQKAIATVFAAQAAHEVPNAVRDIVVAKTPEERDEAIKSTIENAAVLGGTGAHILDRARAANASAGDPNAPPVTRTFNAPPEEPEAPAGLGPSPNEPPPAPPQPSPESPNLALPPSPVPEPVSPAANEPATGNELAVRQQELAQMAPNDPMRPLVELQVKQLTEGQQTAPQSQNDELSQAPEGIPGQSSASALQPTESAPTLQEPGPAVLSQPEAGIEPEGQGSERQETGDLAQSQRQVVQKEKASSPETTIPEGHVEIHAMNGKGEIVKTHKEATRELVNDLSKQRGDYLRLLDCLGRVA